MCTALADLRVDRFPSPVSDDGIKAVAPMLRRLHARGNPRITGASIRLCTALTDLRAPPYAGKVLGAHLQHLTALTSLDISCNADVGDAVLMGLTRLRGLMGLMPLMALMGLMRLMALMEVMG